jgi:hypothetical protein
MQAKFLHPCSTNMEILSIPRYCAKDRGWPIEANGYTCKHWMWCVGYCDGLHVYCSKVGNVRYGTCELFEDWTWLPVHNENKSSFSSGITSSVSKVLALERISWIWMHSLHIQLSWFIQMLLISSPSDNHQFCSSSCAACLTMFTNFSPSSFTFMKQNFLVFSESA